MSGLYSSSKIASDVSTEVKRIFGDEADIQISSSDIYRWIDIAQREIAIHNRTSKATGTTDITSGISEYSMSGLDIAIIQSIHYKGNKLCYRSFQDAEEYVLSKDPLKTSTGDPCMWYEWGGTINLYPVPNETIADGLVVYYIKEPSLINNMFDYLEVPDSYFESVVQFCLSKAYELDEDMDNSRVKLDQFHARLGILAEQETSASQRSYPRIHILEDDSW